MAPVLFPLDRVPNQGMAGSGIWREQNRLRGCPGNSCPMRGSGEMFLSNHFPPPTPPKKGWESSGTGFNVTSGNQYGSTGERFLGTDEQGASLKNYFFFIIRKAQ